jgi:RluA family pseudouridine synthase
MEKKNRHSSPRMNRKKSRSSANDFVRKVVGAEHAGMRLDLYLKTILEREWQREVSRNQVKSLLDLGLISIHKRSTRLASKPVFEGAEVLVKTNSAQAERWLKTKEIPPFELQAQNILYEDRYIIALNKPAHLPTQATLDPTRDHLFASVQRYLRRADPFRRPYVGLHHRLDRDTSGIVLMTKKKMANKAVADLFSQRQIIKSYLALIQLEPGQILQRTWEVKNHLGKVGSPHFKIQSVRSGGQMAHTTFQVLETWPGYALVSAFPHTGRTHQIRVHLAEQGWPIVGDPFYGRPRSAHAEGPTLSSDRTLLHAERLVFKHPIENTKLEIEAPPPPDLLQALQCLRSNVP